MEAEFTALCNESKCKVVAINAGDLIRSFKNCIERVK